MRELLSLRRNFANSCILGNVLTLSVLRSRILDRQISVFLVPYFSILRAGRRDLGSRFSVIYRDRDVPPTARSPSRRDLWSRFVCYRDRDVPPTAKYRDRDVPPTAKYRDRDVPPTARYARCYPLNINSVCSSLKCRSDLDRDSIRHGNRIVSFSDSGLAK